MGAPVDVSVGAVHTTLSNIDSDGTIAIAADDTPVLAATVPLTTGPVPLNATSLFALIYASWHSVANDGTKSSKRDDALIGIARGAAGPGDVELYTTFVADADLSPSPFSMLVRELHGLRIDAPSYNAFTFFTGEINEAGDYELSFVGNEAAGFASKVHGLSVRYRVVGAQ